MSIFSRVSIGVALAMVVALGAAWIVYAPARQPATVPAPVAQSAGDSGEQRAQEVEPVANVADQPSDGTLSNDPSLPSDPPLSAANDQSAANDEPAGVESVPLDLTEHYTMKASNFDRSTRYPWPSVPRGSQTFANVPLEIGGAIFLWGERNASRGQVYPEQITGIPLQQKFEVLYVCHAAFFEGPAGMPMCEIVFHYEDETSASDTIVCGGDARDWFANRAELPLGPSAPRSTLAWDGDGKFGERTQAIRFCLTAIENPHPDKVVTALDLVSSKTQTAACILAVTTGKSGLMQHVEETRPDEAPDK